MVAKGIDLGWFWLSQVRWIVFFSLGSKISDGDQAQEDMEANQQDQEEVEAQIEDAHGGQSPPQRITRSMFKALGARGHLFSLFLISLAEGA